MSKSTISSYQLFELFPDEDSARVYLESRLWPDGPVCPACHTADSLTPRKRVGFLRCNPCQLDFTVRTGTIFERSHVPLNKWIYAMYLLVTARKGISSLQLAKEIGVTQKTAWFILGRLREACGTKLAKLQGTGRKKRRRKARANPLAFRCWCRHVYNSPNFPLDNTHAIGVSFFCARHFHHRPDRARRI
jgi:transposase-like protein